MSNVSNEISNVLSDINEIRRDIAKVESENSRLESEINSMVGAVREAKNDVLNLYDYSKNSIDRGVEVLNTDEKILKDTINIQSAITNMHAEYKNMEKAYKTIRKLSDELNVLDENNRNVNKTVIAIIDFLRGGIISKDVMFKNIEMLHPMTKDYYMSYIMMALTYWIVDKKVEAEKAVELAMQLESRKTTIFFFVFWTKQERFDVARKWLKLLMKEQLKNEDENLLFLMVLFSFEVGVEKCDSEFLEEVKKFLDKLMNESHSEESHAVVDKIYDWYNSIVGNAILSFNGMSQMIEEYNGLIKAMTLCKANEDILQALNDITIPSYIKINSHYIDAMLEDFVYESMSKVGEEIAEKIVLQEEIIKNHGKKFDALQSKSEKTLHRLEKINFKENMYKWLQIQGSFEGEKKVSAFAFNNLRNLYTTAYARYCSSYNAMKPEEITIKTKNYTIKTKFENLEAEIKNVEDKIEEKKTIEIKGSRKTWKYIVYPFFAILFLVLAGVFAKNIYFAPIGFCLFGLNICFTLIAMYRNKATKVKIEDRYNCQKYEIKEKLSLLFAEYQRYNLMFEKYDSVSKKIYSFLSASHSGD